MWKINGSVVWCVFIVICAQALAEERQHRDSRAVRTSQGPVRGFKADDGDYFVFYNIPYATAPTGKDRFKAPLPGPVWLSERQAVNERIICPQAENTFHPNTNKTMQENCLIANVYVPNTDQTNLPVVVYVHGGAYQIGYGELGVPKSFMKTKKFMAVTFNYRLGIHGFLCLGTKEVPGNAGMKDQVALLRWVKKNIAYFGGNPNDVTIDGYSAGSSSVDLLMISDITKGLFHKVIPQSGANLAPWSVQYDPIEISRSFAEEFYGYKGGDDINALEKFYQGLSYEDMNKYSVLNKQHFYFVPCVERDTGVERFLNRAPFEILKEGKYNKLPMLYGFSNMEGLFRFDVFKTWKDKMNDNFADFLPVDLTFKDEEERQHVANMVKKFYFGDEDISEDNIVSYTDYFTDILFATSTLWSSKLQVEAGNDNIYLYMFSYADESLSKMGGVTDPRLVGANHCAQTFMALDLDFITVPEQFITDDYKKVKATVMDIWTNFVTTGKPVPEESSFPEWPAASADGSPHMSIDTTLELRGALLEERAQFWLQVYEKYYRIPSPPPAASAPHAEL